MMQGCGDHFDGVNVRPQFSLTSSLTDDGHDFQGIPWLPSSTLQLDWLYDQKGIVPVHGLCYSDRL